jgi:hypothetical protein
MLRHEARPWPWLPAVWVQCAACQARGPSWTDNPALSRPENDKVAIDNWNVAPRKRLPPWRR